MKLMDWLLGLPVAGLGLWLISHAPDLKWHEEVQLQTGEVIVIERTARFSDNPNKGGKGESFDKGMTIEFKTPAKPDSPTMWSGLHLPMILDRDPDTHEWIIVATLYHCESWHGSGRPTPAHMTYRYRDGKWFQQSTDPKWIGRSANLIPISPLNEIHISGNNPILTISEKEKLLRDRPDISPGYKIVVENWRKNC